MKSLIGLREGPGVLEMAADAGPVAEGPVETATAVSLFFDPGNCLAVTELGFLLLESFTGAMAGIPSEARRGAAVVEEVVVLGIRDKLGVVDDF
jgi:hypothetical protein